MREINQSEELDMENKIYVSDIITTDVVEELEPDKNYLIGSEMNSGKNYCFTSVL